MSVASTALAAESLLSPGAGGEGVGVGEGRAAICSKSVIDIHPELEALYEGTQDRSGTLSCSTYLLTLYVLYRTLYSPSVSSPLDL